MDQSRSEVPFLEAGPSGAVRPKEERQEERVSNQNEATSARTVASVRSRFRETVVTPELLQTLDVAQERGNIRVHPLLPHVFEKLEDTHYCEREFCSTRVDTLLPRRRARDRADDR